MDNLIFAIAAPRRFWRKAYHGNSVIQRVFQALSGVAGFIIMGGRFGSYSMAGFNHNRWPVWVGIRTYILFSSYMFFISILEPVLSIFDEQPNPVNIIVLPETVQRRF
jgi:hypothetical protein